MNRNFPDGLLWVYLGGNLQVLGILTFGTSYYFHDSFNVNQN